MADDVERMSRESLVAGTSDGSELFEDPEFRAHFEDAHARSALLRELVAARRGSGQTQTAVALRMATTQSTISHLEGGGSDPRLSTLQRYARAVGGCLLVTLRALPASIATLPLIWPTLNEAAAIPPEMVDNVGLSRSGSGISVHDVPPPLSSPRDLDELLGQLS